jgi:hypothetical protein
MSDFAPIRETLERANSLSLEDAAAPNTKIKLSPARAVEQTFAPATGTMFEQNARQQCEVRLLMHRQLENALVEQVDLATKELLGVRNVILADEALLNSLNSK